MGEPIKAKLNRGPQNGKRMVLRPYEDTVEVMKPPSLFEVIEKKEMDPSLHLLGTRGSYRRSNRQLKDGTWVFEWMGWYGK